MAENGTWGWILEKKDNFLETVQQNQMLIMSAIFLLVIAPWGRRFWMNVLHFGMFVKGCVAVIVPERPLLFMVNGTIDEGHIQMMRSLGLMMLLWVLGYVLLVSSNDNTTHASFIWTLTVMMVLGGMAFMYAVSHPGKKAFTKFDAETLSPQVYSLGLVIAICLYYSLTLKDWGGYIEPSSHANFHLRLNFVFLLLGGVSLFVMPGSVCKLFMGVGKIDAVHTYLMRAGAVFLIGMALMSGRSANFLYPGDKECLLFSQWLLFVVASINSWCTLYGRWADVTASIIVAQILSQAVPIMNCTGALDIALVPVFKLVVFRLRSQVRGCCASVRALVLRRR